MKSQPEYTETGRKFFVDTTKRSRYNLLLQNDNFSFDFHPNFLILMAKLILKPQKMDKKISEAVDTTSKIIKTPKIIFTENELWVYKKQYDFVKENKILVCKENTVIEILYQIMEHGPTITTHTIICICNGYMIEMYPTDKPNEMFVFNRKEVEWFPGIREDPKKKINFFTI